MYSTAPAPAVKPHAFSEASKARHRVTATRVLDDLRQRTSEVRAKKTVELHGPGAALTAEFEELTKEATKAENTNTNKPKKSGSPFARRRT